VFFHKALRSFQNLRENTPNQTAIKPGIRNECSRFAAYFGSARPLTQQSKIHPAQKLILLSGQIVFYRVG
jgi:hypothetical protein